MIAAIYARKSTDQRVADEQKSVTRQIAHARAYAARQGWTVADAYVYVDDGISGAEFARRPGFMRLLNALTPRPPFQALIVSEVSRLGREQLETGYALKQLAEAGVRIFSYLDEKEVLLETPTDKFLLAALNFGADLERAKNQQRAFDAALQKARRGHVAGGRCFGYDNLRVDGHVEYRINEAEAAVIRRIFELTAAGVSQIGIAKRLNAEGAPAPRAQRARPQAWAPSSVHEVLHRRRYCGEIVWNKTRKRDQWGKQRIRDRAPAEWVKLPAPALCIVPAALWQAAHTHIGNARESTTVRRGRHTSRYLLPGLARCTWCNGGLHVRTRQSSQGARRTAFYACTSHFNRGEAVCGNAVQVPMTTIDAAVIAEIRGLLTPDLVDAIIDGVRDVVEPTRRRDTHDHRAAQLAALERQAANLAEAIAVGGDVPVLVAKLQDTERRRQALLTTSSTAPDRSTPMRIDWRAVERQARAVLADWHGLLGRQITDARVVLRTLLAAPIQFTPILEATRCGYHFEGAVSTGAVWAGTVMLGTGAGNNAGVPGQN